MCCAFCTTAKAQVFLNGDFEINTANPCDFNLSNALFNSKISNTTAYGGGNELDIMQSCGYGAPQNGTWFIGVASPSGITDAFTMTLSTPLIAGNPYTISFYDKGDVTYSPALPVFIGVSTVAGTQGTIVYNGPTPTLGVWNNRTFGFTAPVGGQYISVSTPGPTRWVHVDNFTLLNGLPLSVELVNSEASCTGDAVLILWSTSTEINNDYFLIEKSEDGINFTEIGTVASAGNSQQTTEYSFTDYNTENKKLYYRLKQVDTDGKQTELGKVTTHTACIDGEDEIHTFYNQQSGLDITINASHNCTYRITLLDAMGKIVQAIVHPSNEGVNHFIWNISGCSTGIYVINFESENEVFSTKVLIGN
jgi:hypothetical protein